MTIRTIQISSNLYRLTQKLEALQTKIKQNQAQYTNLEKMLSQLNMEYYILSMNSQDFEGRLHIKRMINRSTDAMREIWELIKSDIQKEMLLKKKQLRIQRALVTEYKTDNLRV